MTKIIINNYDFNLSIYIKKLGFSYQKVINHNF